MILRSKKTKRITIPTEETISPPQRKLRKQSKAKTKDTPVCNSPKTKTGINLRPRRRDAITIKINTPPPSSPLTLFRKARKIQKNQSAHASKEQDFTVISSSSSSSLPGNVHLVIPMDLENYAKFSNFFNKCVQCDEEFLCHIKLKCFPREHNRFISSRGMGKLSKEELRHKVAKESVDYVNLRAYKQTCPHDAACDIGVGKCIVSPAFEEFPENLVKVEISEAESNDLKIIETEMDQCQRRFLNNVTDFVSSTNKGDQLLTPTFIFSSIPLMVTDERVEDIQVLGIGRAVGTLITFTFNRFQPSSLQQKTSNVDLLKPDSQLSKVIRKRPGGRQLPPQPLKIPTVINGVNVAAFTAKLDNLRMCGICHYPANGMVDLNTHQRIAHSLYKGKVTCGVVNKETVAN